MNEQTSPEQGSFHVDGNGAVMYVDTTPQTTTTEVLHDEPQHTDTLELDGLYTPLAIGAGCIAIYGLSVWVRDRFSGKK